jgi:hypothetical protein
MLFAVLAPGCGADPKYRLTALPQRGALSHPYDLTPSPPIHLLPIPFLPSYPFHSSFFRCLTLTFPFLRSVHLPFFLYPPIPFPPFYPIPSHTFFRFSSHPLLTRVRGHNPRTIFEDLDANRSVLAHVVSKIYSLICINKASSTTATPVC